MSTSASTSHELNRKALKQPDAFSQTTQGVFSEVGRHKLVWGGVALVLLAAGLAGALYKSGLDKKAAEASDALYQANQSLEKALKSMAEAKAPKDDAAAKSDEEEAAAAMDPKSKDAKKKKEKPAATAEAVQFDRFDVDAKLAEPVKALKSVTEKFAGTRAAFEARLALGDLYYSHGDSAKAVPFYQGAVDGAPRTLERAMALSSLGYALENDGKYAEAIAAFEKALNLGEGSLKADLLLALARNHEQKKDTAKARSTYDQIISQLPNTDASRTAESLKARLE